jgi:hypothetical protein
MGMDVYGLKPKIRKNDGVNTSLNDGTYFRANVWGWRVIHQLTDVAIEMLTDEGLNTMNLNTRGWDNNSGKGLKKVKECLGLSVLLNNVILSFKEYDNLKDDDFIYLNTGMWVDIKSTFNVMGPDGQITEMVGGSLVEQPKEMETYTNWLYFEKHFEGKDFRPAHSITLLDFKEWVSFMNNSGGFQIC